MGKTKKALIHVLDAMDYERDASNTPRIAGIIQKDKDEAFLGFAGKDEFWVKRVKLNEGKAFFTATYNVEGIETLGLTQKFSPRIIHLRLPQRYMNP